MSTAKYKNYTEFDEAKSKCCACEIGKAYNQVVLSDGNKINPKVVFIGEACGAEELIVGKPFVGKAGRLLRATLKEFGFNETNCLITNTIPCRPLNNKFPDDKSLVHSCKEKWLMEELKLLNPDFIVLIGAKSLKFLLNIDGITKERGKFNIIKINNKTVELIAIFHPSYVLRKAYMAEGKEIMEHFRNDIKKVSEIIKK